MTLFYREALASEARAQARALMATNLGMVGGDAAKEALRKLDPD
ncbi:hypothetical protein [Candidatus Dactylopiibacterium carminicum]|nr:hypothetical protein [Candidatus Dactylopiibacterium carminicum]